MLRKVRLRKRNDISRVRRNGKSFAHPLIVLIACSNEEVNTRMGIIASRTMGGAVQRNRAKRRIRAAFYPLIPHIQTGWDLLFIARKPLHEASFTELEAALNTLLKRANVLVP